MAVGHYLTALVLALKAASYIGLPDPSWPFIALCLVSAVGIATVTAFHERLAGFPWIPSVIHLSEALVCAVVACKTHMEGKKGLPFAWATAAIILLGLGAWELIAAARRARPA